MSKKAAPKKICRIKAVILPVKGTPNKVDLEFYGSMVSAAQRTLGINHLPHITPFQVGNDKGEIYSETEPVVSDEMYTNPPADRNDMATFFRTSVSKKNGPLGTFRGRCLVVGRHATEEKYVSLTKDQIEKLVCAYEQIFYVKTTGRKYKDPNKPKNCLGAWNLYHSDFDKKRRPELMAATKEDGTKYTSEEIFTIINHECPRQWKLMTEEQKAPFFAQRDEKKQEHKALMDEYKRKYPKKPVRPRSAYNMFTRKTDKKERQNWKTLPDEAKVPFVKMEREDKVRYEKEWRKYHDWCQKTGRPWEPMLKTKPAENAKRKPKKKTSKSAGGASAAPKKKKRASPAKAAAAKA